MKRLTTKVDDIYTCSYCENQEAINKLAEFENFMEEQGFESLEKLKEFIELQETNIRFYSRISEENSNKNQVLKDRWQKLKEWALYLCYFELVDKMEKLEKEIK